jgi:Protein of unknown function with PCYCGC motif
MSTGAKIIDMKNRSSWVTIVALAIAAAGLACQPNEPAESSPATPPPAAAPAVADPPQPTVVQFTPPPPAYKGELPPLPISGFAPARPPEVVSAVYTFAARHPEVLHYVPCFCGCERSGHKGNDDCFIRSRDANGRPTWEDHGMT